MSYKEFAYRWDQVPIIDDREKDLITYLKDHQYPFRIERLGIGDVVTGRACIEIKRVTPTCDDLKASFFGSEDRIHEQSYHRNDQYPVNYLLLEMRVLPHYDETYNQRRLASLITTLEMDFNTHVRMTVSMEDTVKTIYDQIWHKELRGPHQMTCENKEPKPKNLYEMQVYFISGLLQVGYERALDLLRYFETPLNIIDYIIKTPIRFTTGGRAKDPPLPIGLSGFGSQFFLKNQSLLETKFKEQKEIVQNAKN